MGSSWSAGDSLIGGGWGPHVFHLFHLFHLLRLSSCVCHLQSHITSLVCIFLDTFHLFHFFQLSTFKTKPLVFSPSPPSPTLHHHTPSPSPTPTLPLTPPYPLTTPPPPSTMAVLPHLQPTWDVSCVWGGALRCAAWAEGALSGAAWHAANVCHLGGPLQTTQGEQQPWGKGGELLLATLRGYGCLDASGAEACQEATHVQSSWGGSEGERALTPRTPDDLHHRAEDACLGAVHVHFPGTCWEGTFSMNFKTLE